MWRHSSLINTLRPLLLQMLVTMIRRCHHHMCMFPLKVAAHCSMRSWRVCNLHILYIYLLPCACWKCRQNIELSLDHVGLVWYRCLVFEPIKKILLSLDRKLLNAHFWVSWIVLQMTAEVDVVHCVLFSWHRWIRYHLLSLKELCEKFDLWFVSDDQLIAIMFHFCFYLV